MLTLRYLRELKSLDKPQRHDALVASQDELVAAARDHDFVEFTNRVTVWLINHTDTDEVQEQVKKTSCTWDTNTDGSIDGRFHLDPLSAVAVGTALCDEMQRLFGQQSEGDGKADPINRRRGQALVGLVIGGAEAPGSATTTPLVNLAIGQKILENSLERFVDPDTVWPASQVQPEFAFGKLGFAGQRPAILRPRQQAEGEFGSAKLGVASTPRPRTGRGLNRQTRAAPHLNLESRIDPGRGRAPGERQTLAWTPSPITPSVPRLTRNPNQPTTNPLEPII